MVFVTLISQSKRVFVSWIGASPSADGLLMTSESAGYAKLLKIGEAMRKANAQVARDGSVLYYAAWKVPDDVSIEDWMQLRDAAAKGTLVGGLVRDGAVSSNVVKADVE